MNNENYKKGQKVHVNFQEGGALVNCLILSKTIIKNKDYYDLKIPINKKLKRYIVLNNIESKFFVIPKETNI